MSNEVNADIWVTEHVSPVDIYHHGVSQVLLHQRTSFQDMAIVDSDSSGRALVLDGKWQSSTVDEFLYHEPLVQVACVLHQAPKNVLVLGGGEGATVREALKWKSVEKVVMVDLDDEVVEACKKYLGDMHQGAFDDPRTELVIGDALNYLDDSQNEWDIIISDLSDPIEEGPSFKLFTKEYFAKTKNALRDDGVFVVQAGPTAPSEMDLHVRLINTLKAVYPHVHGYNSYVPSYVSPWGFGIARNQPLEIPSPTDTDRLLKDMTTGSFKMFDGVALTGLWHTPKHLRDAYAAETCVYTESEPPKFFGKGITQT